MYNNATRVLGFQRNIFIWINYEVMGRSEMGGRLHLGVSSSLLPYQFFPTLYNALVSAIKPCWGCVYVFNHRSTRANLHCYSRLTVHIEVVNVQMKRISESTVVIGVQMCYIRVLSLVLDLVLL